MNHLARRGRVEPGGELFGKALESLVHHELCAFRECRDRVWPMAYWRLASGIEVDFVLGDAEVAIEGKSFDRIARQHLGGLVAFAEEHPEVRRRLLVCLEPRRRLLENGIELLPAPEFLRRLWAGEIA